MTSTGHYIFELHALLHHILLYVISPQYSLSSIFDIDSLSLWSFSNPSPLSILSLRRSEGRLWSHLSTSLMGIDLCARYQDSQDACTEASLRLLGSVALFGWKSEWSNAGGWQVWQPGPNSGRIRNLSWHRIDVWKDCSYSPRKEKGEIVYCVINERNPVKGRKRWCRLKL